MFAAAFPLLAAVLQASSFTLDKAILNIRRINYRTYVAISFPMLLVIDLAIFAIFKPPLDWSLFTGRLGALLFATIGVLIGTNLLYYRALKDDHLSEIQTVGLIAQVPVVIVTGILFADERNFVVIIPALVASLALVWSHWEHHRLAIRAHTLPFILWIFVTAPVMAAMAKLLLAHWHPISLELVRDGSTALVLGPLFASSVRLASPRSWFLLVATNVLSACAWILYFLGYQRLGVVYTVLLFSLQPLLVYLFSLIFLGEPLVKKKFIAFLIVLASIAAAQAMR